MLFVNQVWVRGGAVFLTVLQVKRRHPLNPPPQPSHPTCYLFVILDRYKSSVTQALECNSRRVRGILKVSGDLGQSVGMSGSLCVSLDSKK
jgi:hypothetical protein